MARNARVWWRKNEGCWYSTINGKQVRLGKDKKKAEKQFHELMLRKDEAIPYGSVAAICDAFLDHVLKEKKERTYDWYSHYLQSFCTKYGRRDAAELKPKDVREWAAEKAWGNSTRRAAFTAVKACFSWAAREGHVDRSPVAALTRPAEGKRVELVSEDEYKKIVARTAGGFRDMLVFAWESGARPQECFAAEERHFDKKNSRLVFPKEEAKGGKEPRIIYLNPVALGVVERNLGQAHLFLCQSGPFNKDIANCRFRRLKKHVGKKYCLYMFRHAFATRMLKAGVDPLTVAILMGHANPAILSTTYQHLAFDPENLLRQLKKGG